MARRIVNCASRRETEKAVGEATDVLRRGGLVVFPTETVYGVAATVASAGGINRLRALKDRPPDKPFSVHLPGPEAVERYVDLDAQPVLRRLVAKTMPGPITVVVDVADAVIERKIADMGLPADARSLLYHGNTIGLRCPDHPVAEAFLGAADLPVVASSANRAGKREPHDVRAAARAIGDEVDLILDGGTCRHAQPSTVVRVAGDAIEVLRKGVYDQRYLSKRLRRAVLFVCSGNTCRSPMAKMIAEARLAKRLGVKPDQLGQCGWDVWSAGIHAPSGAPATPEAVEAVRRMDIEPTGHCSRPVTLEMLRQAEVIYCMTRGHRQAVASLLPGAGDRAVLLDEAGDIEDPIGASAGGYERCARRIAQAIDRRFDELGVPADGRHDARRSARRSIR